MRFGPKEEEFFGNFEDLAAKVNEAGDIFTGLLTDFDYAESKIIRLKEIEHDADAITHRIKDKMYRTYLAPIDPEDVYALADKLDSILDVTNMAAVRIKLYVITPDRRIQDLSLILKNAVAKIAEIIPALKQKKNFQMILDGCKAIKSLEDQGDAILHEALRELFEKEKDSIKLIQYKENLERIEEAVNLCEDVADILEGIVLKNG